MNLAKLMGEQPTYRWVGLVLVLGLGLAEVALAIARVDSTLLARGTGVVMIGVALFNRPLSHFSGLFSAAVFSRLASSPTVLVLWVGGWVLFWFGFLTSIAL